MAEAELAGQDAVVLRVGNVQARRDFTDVRDVVRATRAGGPARRAHTTSAAGRSVSVAEIIEMLRAAARVECGTRWTPLGSAPTRYGHPRVGRAPASRDRLGPEIPLERTVADALEAWRVRLVAA